ncbi:unnamed protein product [Prorocentrum cordatum]|uniref:Acetyl-coenzyme A carboxylase carboxyl transferase subunit beta domain-containing protein n=1 Tax=Prorocentrum cordatum TaxID=2364126 RepID=A0ABN9STX4_9DINO|nr:unnamed protein product [Polarella glacialis]
MAPEPPAYDPESLLGVIPESTQIPFDIREARYGPTMVCGWAHIEGYPVGILGNNGMLFSESAIKASHFVQVCGQRGVLAIIKGNSLKRAGQPLPPPEVMAQLKQPIIDGIEKKNSGWHSTAGAYDDGMIDPRDTRKVLAQCISISMNAPLPEMNYGVFRM